MKHSALGPASSELPPAPAHHLKTETRATSTGTPYTHEHRHSEAAGLSAQGKEEKAKEGQPRESHRYISCGSVAAAVMGEADSDREKALSSSAHDSRSPETEHARPRKRTRRACDKCSASRTRCDGECPCRRCGDYGYTCRYNREVKKRGRLPALQTADGASKSRRPARENGKLTRQGQALDSSPSATSPDMGSSTTSHHPFPASEGSSSASAVDQNAAPSQPRPLDHPDSSPSHHDLLRSIGQPLPQARTAAPLSVSSLIQIGLEPSQRASLAPALPTELFQGHFGDAEVIVSDESVGSSSPANCQQPPEDIRYPQQQHRGAFRSTMGHRRIRDSFSTTTTGPDDNVPIRDFLGKAPTEECCFKFLDPVLPFLRDIIPASVACDLLDIFLTDPGSSVFRVASPYILTRIYRKGSITHPTNPRKTSPALLATILWCVAQTADVMLLHVPGFRAKICNELYDLATSLIAERDPDRWRRTPGGLSIENDATHPRVPNAALFTTPVNKPSGDIDDVLTFILLSVAVSGSDFKSDCYKWWSKATRLAFALDLNREDERCSGPVTPCASPLCSCRKDLGDDSAHTIEQREERRRVFWLLYALDRHLALSFNTTMTIPDSYCEVYAPLPEDVWENLDSIPPGDLPIRVLGPPTTASGSSFFEYFLPLMAILGDILEVHHRRRHSRLGEIDDSHSVAVIQELLSNYELSLESLSTDGLMNESPMPAPPLAHAPPRFSFSRSPFSSTAPYSPRDPSRERLAKAYSTHILHVLHVLLHGKWDAISMLDDGDDWILSKRFNECASHAISASQSVSTILTIDPELTFMSYLFGIYLLQGSFILLLFADRMPQLGPNESVAQACEVIIRAHEVCVVTLNTEFQKNFRKVLRSTLYSVQGAGTTNWDEYRSRRRALSLYRWTKGAKGLGL